MEIATTNAISDDFLGKVAPSLEKLTHSKITLVERLRFRSSRRYVRLDKSRALSEIKGFFECEFAEMRGEDEPFDADYFLEYEDGNKFLHAKIRLSTPDIGGGTWYGISARRIGSDDYIIDKEGFFR